jgi:hypothetical protein
MREIQQAYERLQDIRTFVDRLPRQMSRRARVNHLRLIIEAYLQEFYILRGRLVSYLNLIKKLHRTSPRRQAVYETAKRLEEMVTRAMKAICDTRSVHVHVKRFTHQQIEGLDTLIGFLSNLRIKGVPPIGPYFEFEYGKCRQYWIDTFRRNDHACRRLMNLYFGALRAVLVDRRGQLVLPSSGR